MALATVLSRTPVIAGFDILDIANHIRKGLESRKIWNSQVDNVSFAIAPSFGKLTKDSVKFMDEKLKVMMAGTIRELKKHKNLTWENVLSIMNQNSLVCSSKRHKPIFKNKTYTRNSDDFFKVDGSADEKTIRRITNWFRDLIADEDILQTTAVDISSLATIVAETGVTVTGNTFFHGSEYEKKTVIDIGVIRFPDISAPYFKLYRIKLDAIRSCERVLMVESNRNSLNCEFNVQCFEPREEVISQLKKETVQKAVQEVDNLFAD